MKPATKVKKHKLTATQARQVQALLGLRLTDGEARSIYMCQDGRCRKIHSHDFIPYGLGVGVWRGGCLHSAGDANWIHRAKLLAERKSVHERAQEAAFGPPDRQAGSKRPPKSRTPMTDYVTQKIRDFTRRVEVVPDILIVSDNVIEGLRNEQPFARPEARESTDLRNAPYRQFMGLALAVLEQQVSCSVALPVRSKLPERVRTHPTLLEERYQIVLRRIACTGASALSAAAMRRVARQALKRE